MRDEYEPGMLELMMDVMIPCLPLAGLIAVPIGLIDLSSDLNRVQTQGVIRVLSAVVAHAIYAAVVIAAIVSP